MEKTGLSDYTGLGSVKRSQMEEENMEILGELIFYAMSRPGVMEGSLPVVESVMDRWAGDAFFKRLIVKQAMKHSKRFIDDLVEKGRGLDGKLERNISKFLKNQLELKIDKNNTDNIQERFDSIEASANKVLKEFDSGLLFEAVKSAQEAGVLRSKTIKNIFDANPTKVATMLAVVVAAINNQAASLGYTVNGVREFPPDVIVQLVGGVTTFLDTEKIGQFLNAFYDVHHMVHIGSLLLGDSKKSRIQDLAQNIVSEVLPHIDPVIYRKKRIGVKENTYAIKDGTLLASADFPEFVKETIVSDATLKNAEIKHLRNKLKVAESLPEDELADALEERYNTLDVGEMADIATSFLELVNTFHENKPEVIPMVVSELVQAIDLDELETFCEEIVPQVVTAIKPTTDVMMPSLINGLCDLMTPSPGDDSSELDSAMDRLRNLLSNGGE